MSVVGTIGSINPDIESTWRNKIFLTFDMDWAHDIVLNDTIDLVEAADVPATWFITHASPVVERLRENPKFELGVHPNFNLLFSGNFGFNFNAKKIVTEIMGIVPEAKCIRSHSMTQSSSLVSIFSAAGLTHEVNEFIPASIGLDLKPWLLWNGLTRVPYFWEDDIYCLYEGWRPEPDIKQAASEGNGIKVFDLHPIHIFINTDKLDRYESLRELHQYPNKLLTRRYQGYGTRDRLVDLLAIMKIEK